MAKLHNVQLSPAIVQHVVKRRGGKFHAYDQINPANTALIIIDMQNLWLQNGMAGYSPYCAGIVPVVNKLTAAFRKAGSKIYWVKAMYGDDAPKTWSSYMEYLSPEDVSVMLEALTEGHPAAEIWRGMDVQQGDKVLDKKRFSAFISGSSKIERHLRRDGIDTLIITGVATDVCVESTARDAYMLNFRTIVVSDATATRSDEAQNASLSSLFNHFADIFSSDELFKMLKI
ncbi:MAG: cysteine hydrolase [Pseudomonadota bacterium]|nr:cysteine hydrolase [Pseudomonadota bacterium]